MPPPRQNSTPLDLILQSRALATAANCQLTAPLPLPPSTDNASPPPAPDVSTSAVTLSDAQEKAAFAAMPLPPRPSACAAFGTAHLPPAPARPPRPTLATMDEAIYAADGTAGGVSARATHMPFGVATIAHAAAATSAAAPPLAVSCCARRAESRQARGGVRARVRLQPLEEAPSAVRLVRSTTARAVRRATTQPAVAQRAVRTQLPRRQRPESAPISAAAELRRVSIEMSQEVAPSRALPARRPLAAPAHPLRLVHGFAPQQMIPPPPPLVGAADWSSLSRPVRACSAPLCRWNYNYRVCSAAA